MKRNSITKQISAYINAKFVDDGVKLSIQQIIDDVPGATVSNIDRCRYKYHRSITKSKGYLISKNRDNYMVDIIENMQKNIAYLENELQQSKIIEVDEIVLNKINESEEEIKLLNGQIDILKKELIKKKDKELQSYLDEIKKLKDSRKDWQKYADELKQEIKDLKGGTENPEQSTKLNELEKEVAYLKSQVDIVTDLRNRYQNECEKLKSENAGFNKRIDSLNVEITKLKDTNVKLFKQKEYYKEVMQDLKDKYEVLTPDMIYMYENADNCTTENINMSAMPANGSAMPANGSAVTDHTTSSADNKVAAVKQPETTDNAEIDNIVADLTSKDEKVIPFKGHRFNPEDAKDEIDKIVADLTSNNNTETEVIKLSNTVQTPCTTFVPPTDKYPSSNAERLIDRMNAMTDQEAIKSKKIDDKFRIKQNRRNGVKCMSQQSKNFIIEKQLYNKLNEQLMPDELTGVNDEIREYIYGKLKFDRFPYLSEKEIRNVVEDKFINFDDGKEHDIIYTSTKEELFEFYKSTVASYRKGGYDEDSIHLVLIKLERQEDFYTVYTEVNNELFTMNKHRKYAEDTKREAELQKQNRIAYGYGTTAEQEEYLRNAQEYDEYFG